MSLAAFHTLFIGAGAAIFLPYVNRFARVIERFLPDEGPPLTKNLDATLLQAPSVALEATRRALIETATETFNLLRSGLGGVVRDVRESRTNELKHSLNSIQEFFRQIPSMAEDEPLSQLRVAQMHAIDHLARLQMRLDMPQSVRHILDDLRLRPARDLSYDILEQGATGLMGNASTDWLTQLKQDTAELTELRRKERPLILQQTARGDYAPTTAVELLDAMRWLDRLGYHAWRICIYLCAAGDGDSSFPSDSPDESL